jgi:hypothetical protein
LPAARSENSVQREAADKRLAVTWYDTWLLGRADTRFKWDSTRRAVARIQRRQWTGEW